MSGINKAIIIGNCGKDPDVRALPGGDTMTTLSVATSESWTDKATGQKQERTEWHSVVFFKRLAEIAGQHLRKGSKVYVEGQLRTRKWQDRDGADRYTTEIVAREMQMLDSKMERAGDRQPSGVQQRQANQASQRFQEPATQPAQPIGATADFDDEIPF